jgi:cyanophycin synthetase
VEVQRIRALRGPNLWSRHTAIEAIVYCDKSEQVIHNLPEFEIKLRTLFPQLRLMRVSQMDEVISMALVLEHIVLGLQAQAGCPVTFSRTVKTKDNGVYQVVVEYSEESVGRLAFNYGLRVD